MVVILILLCKSKNKKKKKKNNDNIDDIEKITIEYLHWKYYFIKHIH